MIQLKIMSEGSNMTRMISHAVIMAVCGYFLTAVASAQNVGGTLNDPITVYTQNAGPDAAALIDRAQQQGRIRVIVGLSIVMRPEHTLPQAEADRQLQALQSVQTAVAMRTLGRASGDDIVPFTFIPYIAMFVNAEQVARLLADPQVVSVQEDVPQPPLDKDSIPLIHADDIWAKSADGNGYKIAILDTGVAKTHPVLSGKVVSEACYSTNNGANIKSTCPGGVTSSTAPGSGVNCPTTVSGCDHGTHVASIAAATKTADLIGVAKGAKIIAIQVFTRFNLASDCVPNPAPCARSYTTDQIKALQRVYALRATYQISSVNMSLGGGKYTGTCDALRPALTTAIANLRSVNVATLIASGNNGYTGFISSPACISKAIAVGNTTKTDLVAKSSNHSSLVKLLAPGTNIYAAVPPNKYYGVKSGTSMAAPHVAGAFAMLKQAKKTATVNDILTALMCTGKTVDRRSTGTGSVALNPAKPRIDLLGAYNYLLKPPNVVRSWTFDSAAEALDFTEFRGKWSIANSGYRPTPMMQGWVGTSVDNCDKSLQVIANMIRIDPGVPGMTIFANSGIFFKSTLDYKNRLVSGYWLAYNRCPTDSDGNCTGDPKDPPGQAVFWRATDFNLETDTGGGTLFCQVQAPVNVGAVNTIKIVSHGSSHSYYLNNKLVCTVNDATYTVGPVMAATYVSYWGTTSGHAYSLKYLNIKSLDTAAPLTAEVADALGAADSVPDVMDPTAYAPRAIPVGVTPAGVRLR